jgi:hypothetical protein
LEHGKGWWQYGLRSRRLSLSPSAEYRKFLIPPDFVVGRMKAEK